MVDSTLYLTLNVGGVCWLQIYTNYFWQGDSYISNFSLGSDYFRRIVNIQNKLLVGSDSGNIKKFFVYDPATPMYINQTNLFYNIKSMELFGNKLVVTDSEHFIIMNPESFDISLILPISNIVGYSIQGNLAYLANNLGTVFIMNITDITKTNAIAHLIFETSLYGLAIFGNILFVSTQNIFYGIKTARMFDEPLNQLVYPGLTVNRVRIFGDYAYICTSSDIKILDLHNNSIVGSYSHSGQAVKDCYQNGDLLYVLFEDSVIRYIDIANPNNPFFVNEFYTGLSNAFSMEASGKYLYVCLLGSGVEIVNMSNPNALSIVAVIPNAPGSFAYDCAIVGDHLYIINYNELCVYNILIPEYPINIINITAPYIYSVGVSYPFLFVGTTLGYTVYNISSNTPTWIMAFDTGGSNSMAIKRSGEFLLVGSAGSGLKMIDVKSADRNDIKYNNMTGTIESIDAFYDKMILAQYTDGFLVSKIRETPLDFSNGVPFLEIFWLNKTTANDTVPTNPPSETPDDGQNNPSPFNWNSLLTFGGPPLVILAIVYLIIKSKGKSGPKAKKIKAITKNKIDKGNVSNPDEFFDSDF